MYTDNNLVLSGGVSAAGALTFQSAAVSASTFLSTNTLDLGSARDIGEGESLALRVEVGTTFAGPATLEVALCVADDAALSTNLTVIAWATLPASQLTAGSRFVVMVPPLLRATGRRYMGVRYTMNAWATQGSVFADIGFDLQDGQKFYPGGFTVL